MSDCGVCVHHGEGWLLTIQSTYGMHSSASHLGENQLISRLQTDRNQFSNNQTASGKNQGQLTHWEWEEDAKQACGYVESLQVTETQSITGKGIIFFRKCRPVWLCSVL